jgi:WD40 repeat protein
MNRLKGIWIPLTIVLLCASQQPGPVTNTLAQVVDDPLSSLAWRPDGTQFATGHFSGNVKIWDASTRQLLQTIPGPNSGGFSSVPAVYSLSWSSDGTKIAVSTTSSFGTGSVWIADVLSGQPTAEFSGDGGVYAAALSPDSSLLAAGVASGYGDFWIRVWNMATSELLAELSGHRA